MKVGFSWRLVNFTLSVVWAIMVPVSIITGWIYSLAFISAASIYANVVSHIAAWRADVPNKEEK
jgi:hypothetical protein